MTLKLINDVECPGCHKKFESEVDVDKLGDVKKEYTKAEPKRVQIERQEETESQVQIKEVPKVPSHIPKFKCKNCDSLHDNPDFTTRPKFKCNNCGALNPTAECQTCNKAEEFEELTDEELDELGIPLPKPHEHTHEA